MGVRVLNDLISIIVPIYNSEKYIDKCIESVVHQTYKNLEIILVDDGSIDNSGKKCDEWARKDNRIKVIHKENGGVSNARNVGLRVAKGKYIGFVDSDDYINENMYEIMHKEMQKDNINFVICDCDIIEPDKIPGFIEKNQYPIEIINKIQAIEVFYPLDGGIWKCLFSKEKLKDITFDTTIYIGEDLDFICNYILDCEDNSRFIFINAKLYYYINREDSVTRVTTSKSKRLKAYIDLKNTRDCVKSMIEERYNNNIELMEMIEKRTIVCYWMDIDLILKERLMTDNVIIKQYYTELKQYKKYFSLKDKFYMMLLGISPKLFEIVYQNIKTAKKLLKK